MDIVIATANHYKSQEMAWFLEGIPNLIVHPYSDLVNPIKVIEDGRTLSENAVKKAVQLSELTEYYVLASDGGNDIPGLGDKWDILRNQRLVGEDKTDLQKAQKLLELMSDLKGEDRRVEYHFALAVAYQGRLLWSGEDVTDRGYILDYLPDGQIPQSFWIGWLWNYPQFEKTNVFLNDQERQSIREIAVNYKEKFQLAIRKYHK